MKFSQQDTTGNDWQHGSIVLRFDIVLFILIFKFKFEKKFENHLLYDSTMSKVLVRVLPALRLPVRGNNQKYDRQVLLIVALIVAHIHFVHLFIELVKQDLNSTILPLKFFEFRFPAVARRRPIDSAPLVTLFNRQRVNCKCSH
jgi:hypothetical protein